MDIRLLAFDLDDTLWDNKPVIARAEQAGHAFLEEFAPEFAAAFNIEQRKHYRLERLQQEPRLAAQITVLRQQCLQQQLENHGYHAPEAHKLAHRYMQVFIEARQQVAPLPGVLPILEKLSQDYVLSAITNGNADVFKTPLASYFSFALRAEEVLSRKPDSVIFHKGLEQAGFAAEHAVYIGDHPYKDVAGAQQVGMRTIWVNYENNEWPGELQEAEQNINSFEQLPAAIAEMNPL